MYWRIILVLVLIGGVELCGQDAELSEEIILENLQGYPDAIEKIELAPNAPNYHTDLTIKLGESVVTTPEGFIFDGFYFMAPESIEGDFVWYFNAPDAWAHWYIIPCEGKSEKGGFRNWLYGDKIYESFDKKGGQEQRMRAFQMLDGDYFEPGKEYLIWFRKDSRPVAAQDSEVRLRMGFETLPADDPESEWGYKDFEKALKMQPFPAEDQIAELKSRGGKILLDEKYFSRKYGEGRIENLFFTKRHLTQTREGFFIKLETVNPVCKTEPPMSEIRTEYGEPDFVRETEELKKKGLEPDEKSNMRTYFYDHFGFVVQADDPDEKVVRVKNKAENFASLRSDAEKGIRSFGRINTENLTTFYDGTEEVGRVYFFLEGEKEMLSVKLPPPGEYRSGSTSLIYLGEGKWTEKEFFQDGKLRHEIPMVENRRQGDAKGYFPDGKTAWTASYSKGGLHGKAVTFDEDGSVRDSQVFKKGIRQEE